MVNKKIHALICLKLLGLMSLNAQNQTYPYLVESVEMEDVVRRAVSDSRGIPRTDLILRPDTTYRLWMLESDSLRVGMLVFQTPGNGRNFVIPIVTFRNPITPDSDGDGLHDEAEFILGTNSINPDTDADGVNDGAEFLQGTNPLDGLIIQTGIVGSVDTEGTAHHVYAFNDLAVITESGRGITLFNVFNAMEPVIVGQVDTAGDAISAHFTGRYMAVADGRGGLVIIDADDPPAASISRVVPTTTLGGRAQTVVTTSDLAYVGTDDGTVQLIDMVSGSRLQEISVDENQVQDLAINEELLIALTSSSLYLFDLENDTQLLSVLPVSGSTAPLEIGRKLFSAGNYAYVGYFQGYSVIDISDNQQPRIIGEPSGTQAAIHDLVLNGSGLLIGTTSFAGTGTLAVSLYDSNEPTDVTRFLTSFDTPGASRAVSIYNGLAYVADSNQGLQVLNILSYDTLGLPPSINLQADFSLNPPRAEEGKLVRVTASVDDDVQVRNVEFYIDGVRAATDGGFPFEYRFTTPLISDRTGFNLRARVSDTGGNATWTDTLNVTLAEDVTPPEVLRANPRTNAVIGGLDTLSVVFSEQIDVETLTTRTFELVEAGEDGIFETVDDRAILGDIRWLSDITTALQDFNNVLDPGFYRVTLSTGISDLAGNALPASVNWSFWIFDSGADRDGDGIPDDLESVLGLDPDNPDSNGDGVPDGDEDFDSDGLTNIQEVVLGLDPTDPDQNGDGIPDGELDSDQDGIADVVEVFTHGTDPNNVDTDGDFFSDGDEIRDGSDPLDAISLPPTLFQGPLMLFTIQNQSLPEGVGITLHNRVFPQTFTIKNTVGPGIHNKKTVSPVVGVENQ